MIWPRRLDNQATHRCSEFERDVPDHPSQAPRTCVKAAAVIVSRIHAVGCLSVTLVTAPVASRVTATTTSQWPEGYARAFVEP